MQETQVWSLIREDATCHGAVELCSRAQDPQLLKRVRLRARAPATSHRREKPTQGGQRVAPACHN